MGAWSKLISKDSEGRPNIARIHLIGENTEEDEEYVNFYYTFPPELIVIIQISEKWAKHKSQIMYALKSKYSIRLYEMLEKRVGPKKQSEMFTVDDFARCLAPQKESYRGLRISIRL